MHSQRPFDVLAHQRRRIVPPRLQRRDDLWCGRRIAKPDGEVPQPTLIADAPDRRALQPLVEVPLGPGEQLDQRRAVEAVSRLKIRLGGRTREAIPRTNRLAVVAAVDTVADERAQFFRYRGLVLDGEVGDAAARVQPVRPANRLGRTDIDAFLAAPTVLGHWSVRR